MSNCLTVDYFNAQDILRKRMRWKQKNIKNIIQKHVHLPKHMQERKRKKTENWTHTQESHLQTVLQSLASYARLPHTKFSYNFPLSYTSSFYTHATTQTCFSRHLKRKCVPQRLRKGEKEREKQHTPTRTERHNKGPFTTTLRSRILVTPSSERFHNWSLQKLFSTKTKISKKAKISKWKIEHKISWFF